MAGAVVTVQAPDGTVLGRVTVVGGRARVEPATAVRHPAVAAVAAQLERTAARRRRRPSC